MSTPIYFLVTITPDARTTFDPVAGRDIFHRELAAHAQAMARFWTRGVPPAVDVQPVEPKPSTIPPIPV